MVGEKSPAGADLFAKRNDDKKVFLIQGFQEGTFNKSTFDLRDKMVLKLERDKVDGVEISAGGKKLDIAKDNAEWKITQPIQARADFGAVEGLIGRLQTAAMKAVAAENATPADLKKYGFDKPSATVDLKMGSARATFAVGGKAEDHRLRPRRVEADGRDRREHAGRRAEEGRRQYRRKRSLNSARTTRTASRSREAQTVVFEKVKGEGKDAMDKWRRVSPPRTPTRTRWTPCSRASRTCGQRASSMRPSRTA
jgi:hypothetical protein